MRRFQDVTISWAGTDYVVPAQKRWGLMAAIEQHMTLTEISEQQENGKPQLIMICAAFAAALEFAGAKQKEKDVPLAEEIYVYVFDSGKEGGKVIVEALNTLVMLLVPPSEEMVKAATEGTPPGK